MSLETFLEGVVSAQPSFVLFGGRVYSTLEAATSEDYGDRLIVGGSSLALSPSVTFASFESLYGKTQKKQIDSENKMFVSKAVDKELYSDKENRLNKLRTLKFIMEEIFPLLLARKYDDIDGELLQEMIQGEVEGPSPIEIAKQEIRRSLEERFGSGNVDTSNAKEEFVKRLLTAERAKLHSLRPLIEKKYSLADLGLSQTQVPDSFLGNITSNQPLYAVGGLEGHVFTLIPLSGDADVSKARRRSLVFKLNNRYFKMSEDPIPGLSLGRLSKELLNAQKTAWHVSAIEDLGRDIKIEGEVFVGGVSEKYLHNLSELKEFEIDGFGFLFASPKGHDDEGSNETYWVYKRIPKFATQNGQKPEEYLPYEEMRVAINVWTYRDKTYTTKPPRVIEKVPRIICIYERSSHEWNRICNSAVDYDSTYSRNTPYDMVRKLGHAVDAVRHPLNLPTLKKHAANDYRFGPGYLKDLLNGFHRLTREEAIAQGYEVYDVIPKKIDENGKDAFAEPPQSSPEG